MFGFKRDRALPLGDGLKPIYFTAYNVGERVVDLLVFGQVCSNDEYRTLPSRLFNASTKLFKLSFNMYFQIFFTFFLPRRS